MKSILISDHAKWCALMMNGEKRIEVRKGTALYKAIQKLIDEYGYADIYVYCSKIQRKHYHLIESIDTDTGKTEYEIDYYIGSGDYLDYCYEGKVSFKFRCYNVEEIAYQRVFEKNPFHFLEEEGGYGTETINTILFKKATCLTDKELENYLNTDKPNKKAYAIHISDLEIFDKPKELWEFGKVGSYNNPTIKCKKKEQGRCNYGKSPFTGKWIGCEKARLTKAPQSWQFIESEELL